MNLFRGAEYQRYAEATTKEPLTYYDMNLSAQDHQTFFSCECDVGKPEYEGMKWLCLTVQNIARHMNKYHMPYEFVCGY